MNPYAPPSAPIVRSVDESGPRALAAEANVRGIGLYWLVGSATVGLQVWQLGGTERIFQLLLLVLHLWAGAALVGLRPIGRVLVIVSGVIGIGGGFFVSTKRSPLGIAIGLGLSLWVLWYLYRGAGARVLAADYLDVLRAHPEPKPRIARWAKLLSVFVVLSLAVWSFMSDVPRPRPRTETPR